MVPVIIGLLGIGVILYTLPIALILLTAIGWLEAYYLVMRPENKRILRGEIKEKQKEMVVKSGMDEETVNFLDFLFFTIAILVIPITIGWHALQEVYHFFPLNLLGGSAFVAAIIGATYRISSVWKIFIDEEDDVIIKIGTFKDKIISGTILLYCLSIGGVVFGII